MTIELEEIIKERLELAHDIAITSIVHEGQYIFNVSGFGARGAFDSKMTLMIVEMGTNHINNQRIPVNDPSRKRP